MANDTLNDLKFAILVTDGFEQAEMTGSHKALDEAGAETQLVSPDLDALMLPGGDTCRQSRQGAAK